MLWISGCWPGWPGENCYIKLWSAAKARGKWVKWLTSILFYCIIIFRMEDEIEEDEDCTNEHSSLLSSSDSGYNWMSSYRSSGWFIIHQKALTFMGSYSTLPILMILFIVYVSFNQEKPYLEQTLCLFLFKGKKDWY